MPVLVIQKAVLSMWKKVENRLLPYIHLFPQKHSSKYVIQLPIKHILHNNQRYLKGYFTVSKTHSCFHEFHYLKIKARIFYNDGENRGGNFIIIL